MPDIFRPRGVFPALVTPFTSKQEVDEKAFGDLIEFVLPKVDGIVVAGTTGESLYLSIEERKRLYRFAVEKVAGRVPVIAGTGEASTCNTIELTQAAQDAGASAALVVTPYFLHPSDKGIHKHFWEVSQNCNIPLILYNIPQTADAVLPRQVIEDLADLKNIIAVKDSSGNLTYTTELLEFVGDRLDILIGHDEVVLSALAAGCSGMILASAQIYPEHWKKVFQAVQENDLETARKTQREVQTLSRIFCRYGGPVPVKAALNMMGLKIGSTRKPLKIGGVLSHEDREEIRIELIKIGKISNPEPEVRPEIALYSRFEDAGITESMIRESGAYIGEASCGIGNEQVHIEILAGKKDSLIGEAYCYQMTHPRHGYEALTAILEPNLTVRPSTILLPAVELKTLRQANMIFGPTQLAVGQAVVQNVEEGIIPMEMIQEIVLLARVFIPPMALDRRLVHKNNYEAANQAIKQAFKGIKQ